MPSIRAMGSRSLRLQWFRSSASFPADRALVRCRQLSEPIRIRLPGAQAERSFGSGDHDRELTSLQVKVAPEDIGKLIGEKGRTARSFRATISAASLERKQNILA